MAVVYQQNIIVPGGLEPYPTFGSLVPALRGFSLEYPLETDREIQLIQVLVGGESEDLSPDAALQPVDIPDGKLWVLLQDGSPEGEWFRYFVSHSLLEIPTARRYQIREVGCVDECVRELPSKVFGGVLSAHHYPVLALVGFKLWFHGRDHELDRVGVWFRDKNLNVALRDRIGNRTFNFLVDFIAIPRVGLNVTTKVENGSSNTQETIPLATPDRAHSLLTGWEFDFQGEIDREIHKLGVVRRNDDFTVTYSDASGGETFNWRVEWALVAPQVLAPPDH